MKISKWPFFVAKIWQTTSTDQQIRKGGSQKNTRKLRMQGGRYETKKDRKRGRAPSQEYGRSYVIQMERKLRLNLLRWHMICWSKNLCLI